GRWCGPGRSDDHTLEPTGGVEVIAGPDHPCWGGRGPAVLTARVTAHRIDQPAVGQLVALEGVRYITPTGEAGGEAAVPVDHQLAAGDQLAPGCGPIASRRVVAL